jgi:DNA-binding MarR family transcriptional regulator
VSKQQAVQRVARAAADFGDAADAVDRAAAEWLGINRTDLRVLAAVRLGGRVSAGALAGAVDLSPGATTEAVQRLVARGLLTRDVDPGDRRRAVITLLPEAEDALEALYGPVRDEGRVLLERYTADELALVADFLDRGRRLQLDAADRIRARRPDR